MPSSPGYKRNYRQEYDRYHSSDEQKKKRAKRNTARRTLAKAGKVRKGDGKDVDIKEIIVKNMTDIILLMNKKRKEPNVILLVEL